MAVPCNHSESGPWPVAGRLLTELRVSKRLTRDLRVARQLTGSFNPRQRLFALVKHRIVR
jgi:hypothetical protein